MTFPLYSLKVTMHSGRPLYRLLQCSYKRQCCLGDRFGHSRCLSHHNNFTGIASCYSRKDKKLCNVSIITIMCGHSKFVSPSFTSSRQFHVDNCEKRVKFTNFSQNSNSHRKCWNCGRGTNPVRELFFCDCGVVQKPASELTYFDLMQLKPSFDIDLKSLSNIFKETQKRLHPDKFSSKTQEERDLAQHQSSLLNKAYNTLQKPLSRAIYLLRLQNIDISEKDTFTEPQFLMEIMETNEQISNVKTTQDIEAVEKANDDKIEACIKEISELCKKNLYEDMKKITIKLRYYTTIQERINELKRSAMG